ncbi:hypothetical protein EON64_14705, partial [archaeon]
MSDRPNSILELARKKSVPIINVPKGPVAVTSTKWPYAMTQKKAGATTCAAAGRMRYVGGHLLDETTLYTNAPSPLPCSNINNSIATTSNNSISNGSNNNTSSTSANAGETKSREEALSKEIASLLGKRSNHESEAEDDWHERYAQQLQHLERQETASLRAAKDTHCLSVRGFECVTCRDVGGEGGSCATLFTAPPPVCLSRKHTVRNVSISKRFYLCPAPPAGSAEVEAFADRYVAHRVLPRKADGGGRCEEGSAAS